MNAEASPHPAPWREGDGRSATPYEVSPSSAQSLRLSAPTAINPATQSAILQTNYSTRWDSSMGPAASERQLSLSFEQPLRTEPWTDASISRTRPHGRHSSTPGGNHGPAPLRTTSPRQAFTGAWRSLQVDHSGRVNNLTDAPLSLHISRTQDLPSIASTCISAPSERHMYAKNFTTTMSSTTTTTTTTSLPSFASFQEQTSRSEDPDVEGPEIAPMSSRLSCYQCTKLKPVVRDVAMAVMEFEETIQTYCKRAVTRTLDFPDDSPVHAVQWILDRLRFAKRDMQDYIRRTQAQYAHSGHPVADLSSPRAGSPSNPLKRQTPWDRDEYAAPKRPRSGPSPDQSKFSAVTPISYCDRKASIDVTARSNYSPPPTVEGVATSAYPHPGSPIPASRSLHPLPSPSPYAYPPTIPPIGRSAGSPTPSHQPSGSIHTVSTSSATSAHIADLQHQVTLKSLSLQTLQSEYASLLQKLQRERVKSQAIEKKTTVADQEVNDLTCKNEELAEQVKNLQSQLDESEKKREAERAEAAREKEQWGRMLEMGGRLHSKVAEDRQKLIEERDQLLRKVLEYEEENQFRINRRKEEALAEIEGKPLTKAAPPPETKALASPSQIVSSESAPGTVAALKRQVEELTAHIEMLHASLQKLKQCNEETGQKSREFLREGEQLALAIDRVLVNYPRDHQTGQEPGCKSGGIRANNLQEQRQTPWLTHPVLKVHSEAPQLSHASATHPSSQPTPTISGSSSTLTETAAAVGRAISPGPEELGFHVQPSTSTPEELIKALGPVPAPVPGLPTPTSAGPRQREVLRDSGSLYASGLGLGSSASMGAERTDAWMMPQLWRSANKDDRRRSPPGIRAHVSPYHHISPSHLARDSPTYRAPSPRSGHGSPDPVRDGISPSNSSTSESSRSPDPHGSDPKSTSARSGMRQSTTRRSEIYWPVDTPGSVQNVSKWDNDGLELDKTTDMPPPPRPTSRA